MSPSTPNSCLIGASDLKSWMKDGALAVVDVRPQEEFQRVRIPNSVNFSLYALKTKEYLKSRKLLIVGESYDRSMFGKTCLDLKERGFNNVAVLGGGLPSWLNSAGRLEGSSVEQLKLKLLPVAGLFRELEYRPWLLIDLSNEYGASLLDGIFPSTNSVQLRFSRVDAHFREALLEAIKSHRKDNSDLAVAVLAPEGAQTSDLVTLLMQPGLEDVFLVEGGAKSVKAYSENNQKIINHLRERLEHPQCH